MEKSQISSSLFAKNGNLYSPKIFQKFGYTWRISHSFCEKHGVPAIDLKLECIGLEEDKFLSIIIEFRNEMRPGKHNFWHVFDRQRNTFCFRRIVTGIRHVRSDGVTVASFLIDRFLRKDELGERYDAEEQKKWPFYAPVTWNLRDDGRVEAESTKICYNRFEYSIVLTHAVTLTSLPVRYHLPKWPKSNRLPVQLTFFEPAWHNVQDVILKMNDEAIISTENYWNLFDVLGVYYHQWQFDENRIMELDLVANRLGFYKFMDGIGLGGDFEKIATSRRTADIVRVSKREQETEFVEVLNKTRNWTIERIPKEEEPPVMLKVLCEFEKIQLTISGYTSKFRDTDYFSIGAVLVGELKEHCVYDCTLEVVLKSEETNETLRETCRRQLNRVQSSMRIPTFCSKEQLEFRRIDNQMQFEIRIQITELISDHLQLPGISSVMTVMPGSSDMILRLDGKSIGVNKTFLAHHAEFFKTMFFNENFEEHRKEVIEMSSVSYEEMLHFLDALYHGTKVFGTSQYYHVLRMSDEWISKSVMDIVEKAMINTKCACVNKQKLAEKFKLEALLNILNETGTTKKREIRMEGTDPLDDPDRKKTRVDNENVFII